MIVVEIGYTKFVLPRDKALQMVEILEQAEVYETKYWNAERRKERNMGDNDYTYHVYPNEKEYSMKIVSDQHYQMAKLAGKPEKD